jgi:hypothetical protein
MDRRAFLTASTMGLASLGFKGGVRASTGPAVASPTLAKPAKSTVLFFLCGGASHIDMWDMKPDAPLEYRGEFKPTRTTPRRRAGALKSCMTEPIVSCAFPLILQHVIGFIDGFEFLLSLFIARIAVGVILHRQLAIGFFDFLIAGAFGNPQQAVIIFGHEAINLRVCDVLLPTVVAFW